MLFNLVDALNAMNESVCYASHHNNTNIINTFESKNDKCNCESLSWYDIIFDFVAISIAFVNTFLVYKTYKRTHTIGDISVI